MTYQLAVTKANIAKMWRQITEINQEVQAQNNFTTMILPNRVK